MKLLNLKLMFLIILSAVSIPCLAQTPNRYACVTDLVVNEQVKSANVHGAVSKPSRKWNPGQQIRVKFLDGDAFVRSKVMQYAKMWEQYANIEFVQVQSGPAEIRVSFTMDAGSWSLIGKNSLRQSVVRNGNQSVDVQDSTGATMNFGWFHDDTPDEEFRRTTLHEFGHALGLLHEHQNKNSNLQFNDEAVYAFFAKQGWDREKVRSQVLERYDNSNGVTSGVYDRFSIMHYFYPPELIKNAEKIPNNTNLSAGDKQIISEMYPFEDDAKVRRPPTVTAPPPVATNAPVFSFSDASVDFEAHDEKTDADGMTFSSDFQVRNGLNQQFSMVIYFYYEDGTPLEDTNRKYNSANGKVAVFRKFTPAYPIANYKDFTIFMPYDELELDCGKYNLKYSMTIWNGQKRVANTGYNFFEMNVPCE